MLGVGHPTAATKHTNKKRTVMHKSGRPVRVRIAPSPTGNCHVGTARNALYNLLFARQRRGSFILRIDDTDLSRSTEESERGVLDGLKWLGLQWDEGPDIGGPFGPYRQSERLNTYQSSAQKLIDEDKAYYCFCTPDELQEERRLAQTEAGKTRYSGRCRQLSKSEVDIRLQDRQKAVIRLKIEPTMMSFEDMVQGHIEQDASLLGDPVIVKSDGMPTYSFATVMDEHHMQISHVLRGAEHISNTFPQLQIFRALGLDPPEFGHFGLLLNPDRSKISKRTGAVYIGEFRDMGYLPEAVLNCLALSGWGPGSNEEIFSFANLLETFSVDRCNRSNAIFDRSKLLWLNGYYIRHLDARDLTARTLPFLAKANLISSISLAKADMAHIERVVVIEQERTKTLGELPERLAYFLQDPEVGVSVKVLETNRFTKRHTLAEIGQALSACMEALSGVSSKDWTASTLGDVLNAQVEHLGWKRTDLLMSVRIAVSGREETPSLFETLENVGKSASVRRVRAVIDRLVMNANVVRPESGS